MITDKFFGLEVNEVSKKCRDIKMMAYVQVVVLSLAIILLMRPPFIFMSSSTHGIRFVCPIRLVVIAALVVGLRMLLSGMNI